MEFESSSMFMGSAVFAEAYSISMSGSLDGTLWARRAIGGVFPRPLAITRRGAPAFGTLARYSCSIANPHRTSPSFVVPDVELAPDVPEYVAPDVLHELAPDVLHGVAPDVLHGVAPDDPDGVASVETTRSAFHMAPR
jgi:hypothetical protein